MYMFYISADKGFSDLPWRARRKGSDVNDIHVSKAIVFCYLMRADRRYGR